MQTLFVWPNRFVLGMGKRDNVRALVRQLQPRVKGLLALRVERAVNLQCAVAAACCPAVRMRARWRPPRRLGPHNRSHLTSIVRRARRGSSGRPALSASVDGVNWRSHASSGGTATNPIWAAPDATNTAPRDDDDVDSPFVAPHHIGDHARGAPGLILLPLKERDLTLRISIAQRFDPQDEVDHPEDDEVVAKVAVPLHNLQVRAC